MWQWLNDFPNQVKQANEIGESWDLSRIRMPNQVAFFGIGGSAIGATLVSTLYREQLNCPVSVCRGNQLPGWIDKRTLVVAVSYSGDTQETTTAFRRALEKGAQGVSLSSGGSLAAIAKELRIPHCAIPGGMAPRAALGYTSLPLIHLLRKIGAIPPQPDPEINNLVALLESLRSRWNDASGPGAGDAQMLIGRFPIIIGGGLTAPIALRFQAQLAENAKTLSLLFEIPEALHNLVETLSEKDIGFLKPIILELDDSLTTDPLHSLNLILRDFALQENFKHIRLFTEGDTPLERLYSLIYKTDWISYFLAKAKDVDPVAIPNITSVKKKSLRL